MNCDRKPSSYVVYLRHESASASSGFQETAAVPTSVASILKNQAFVASAPQPIELIEIAAPPASAR
jgi:hypothetical protein